MIASIFLDVRKSISRQDPHSLVIAIKQVSFNEYMFLGLLTTSF